MRLLTLFFVFLLCCILCCSTAIDGAKTRRRSSLASYSPALSAVESSSSASTLLQSSACVNPGVSLYDAIQTLPDTMIMAQFLKMDEFKHLADVIQNTDNDQRLTMLVPTDESIHHAVLVHYNITCLQSNEILDELIAQVADKSTECKKLDLMVRMTGLMAAMGKKMKAIHKQAYSTGAAASRPMKSSPSAPSQQPIKTKSDDVPSCPANTPCPSTTASDTQSSGAVAQSGELSAVGRRGRKHLLCSSPALRRDALAKLCDQLGIRQEDFNLTFSSLHIHAATDNFLYSIIQGQYTTNQFKATNILPTLLDDPAIVRLNATANTKQMIFIQQSDTNPSRYQVVFDIPSPEHTWYSTIIRPNLAASNGVLHLIDAPIQTPMNPIFHLAHAKFDNFLSMALESRLAPMLANKPGTTIFVPVESANKLIKNAFGFESNEAKFQSMLKNELVSQLNDIISMAKVNQYAMNYLSTMGGQQAVMADKPLSLKILQKARANLMEADSLLNKMEKHSILSNKFGEMHRNEQKAKGVMAANPWVSGGPMAWDPNQWNYQQNIDQIRQAAQNFIARCLQQFGQEGQPPININPRSSTGVIPDSPDTAPQRFGYAAKSDGAARGVLGSGLAAQSKPMQRRRFGMRMKSKDDKSIEVPMKGWEYRLNRPSLLNDPVLTAVEHLFTHEKLLSQSLFDNWNKTQTYADFIQLHTFDGVLYTTNFQDGLSVESMQGQSFTITNASDAGSGTAIWKIDQSTIIFPNIITSNGVIHIIDQPLGIDLLPTHILKQLMHQSPSLRTSLTEKQINRGLLGLLGPCPSPALKALKAKAFPARKQKPLTALPIKSSADQDYDDFDDDDDDDDDFLDDFDDDLQYMIPSSLTDDQQSTIITIRHITEIIAKLAPRRGDEMINGCGEELIKTPKEAAPTTDTFGMAKPATPISPIAAKPTTTTTTPTAAVSGPTISKPVTTITAKPRIGETAPAPMKIAATADQLNCPPNDQVCVVNDPLLYSSPKPICYNNRTHVCVNDSFLCPTHAPNVCGRACYHQAIYSCRYSDTDPYGVRLILKAPYEVGIKKLKPSAVAPAPVSSVQPILDALAQMKAKQTLPTAAAPQKIQQTIVSQPIVDVLTKPVSAPLIQQPVIKQTPIQQAATKTLPSTGNPIVDVLTNPSLLSTPASQQQLKSSAANQPLPLKQSVQAPLPQTTAKQSSSQPIQQPISGQVNPNKPRN